MLKVITSNQIWDKNGLGFDPIDYSKFKFGSKKIARKFGYELADELISLLEEKWMFQNDQIVVCSSPYCFIPTATFAMKDYFVQRLNEFLMKIGKPVIQESKIHRTITYKEDYGGLSAEERMALIGKDTFHIDTEFVKGKTIIFLDDIRITGSHEKVVKRMYDEYGLNNDSYFLYFAVLKNDKIHPSIENDLNYAFVKDLLNLDKIIKNEDFLLNTRVVKYLLNYNHSDFTTFIHYQRQAFIKAVYHAAIGNSYHLIEDYQENFNYLKTLIK